MPELLRIILIKVDSSNIYCPFEYLTMTNIIVGFIYNYIYIYIYIYDKVALYPLHSSVDINVICIIVFL